MSLLGQEWVVKDSFWKFLGLGDPESGTSGVHEDAVDVLGRGDMGLWGMMMATCLKVPL